MMQTSILLSAYFLILVAITAYLFYKASGNSIAFLIIVAIWALLQTVLGITGFYHNGPPAQPRFALVVLPPVLFIIIFLFTHGGRVFVAKASLQRLTMIHTIRIGVEIGLYYLFILRSIPSAMTFEGYNFDILAGISAPVFYYVVFVRQKNNYALLLWWNVISLLLLLNIIVIAVLSLKTPFQQIGFEQPDVALTYFPYNLLPGVIVPLVLFSHFISLKKIFSLKS